MTALLEVMRLLSTLAPTALSLYDSTRRVAEGESLRTVAAELASRMVLADLQLAMLEAELAATETLLTLEREHARSVALANGFEGPPDTERPLR